jgi:Zn-dependent oligopeptidase
MFMRHTVSHDKAWRKVYDGFASTQKAMGVTAQAVYQSADNPNDITVTHDFATIAAAQTFAGSPDLRKAMQGAGVVGAPQSGSQTMREP